MSLWTHQEYEMPFVCHHLQPTAAGDKAFVYQLNQRPAEAEVDTWGVMAANSLLRKSA